MKGAGGLNEGETRSEQDLRVGNLFLQFGIRSGFKSGAQYGGSIYVNEHL